MTRQVLKAVFFTAFWWTAVVGLLLGYEAWLGTALTAEQNTFLSTNAGRLCGVGMVLIWYGVFRGEIRARIEARREWRRQHAEKG